jgi:hypothetical protein
MAFTRAGFSGMPPASMARIRSSARWRSLLGGTGGRHQAWTHFSGLKDLVGFKAGGWGRTTSCQG